MLRPPLTRPSPTKEERAKGPLAPSAPPRKAIMPPACQLQGKEMAEGGRERSGEERGKKVS